MNTQPNPGGTRPQCRVHTTGEFLSGTVIDEIGGIYPEMLNPDALKNFMGDDLSLHADRLENTLATDLGIIYGRLRGDGVGPGLNPNDRVSMKIEDMGIEMSTLFNDPPSLHGNPFENTAYQDLEIIYGRVSKVGGINE